MAGKEYQIAFELKAKLESSYTGSMRKVLDNLDNLEITARAIEAIRISGDMVRPLREGLQNVEREMDQLRRVPRIDGIFTETVRELKEAVQQSGLLLRDLRQISTIRMPSNMFGNDLQRYTRELQEMERRMREISDIHGPSPGDPGGGDGGGSGGGEGGSSGAWALGGAAIAGGLGVAAVAGLGLAGHAAFSFSEEYQEAMNQLQASTNSSAEQMEGFSAIAENLYNLNMGEGFYDVAESMSAVRKVTQLTGSDLESTTKNAMVYSDVFNEDIAESVKAADTMMKNFGITSTEAYNLLAQGASGPLTKSMDLLDTANEYSVYFSKLGFSANQMFDTFSAGMEAGAFSLDKVGDGIKEFGIRTKDGSKTSLEAYKAIGLNGSQMTEEFAAGGKTAQEAFLKTAKAIKAVKDPAVANTVAVQLFGTQAEDLESRVVKAMTSAKSQFDMTKDTMDEIGKVKYNTIGQAFGGIGRTLQTELLLPISKELLPIFSNLSAKMADWVPKITAGFKSVGGAVKEAAKNIKWLFENGIDGEMEGVAGNYMDYFGVDKKTQGDIIESMKGTFDRMARLKDGLIKSWQIIRPEVAKVFGYIAKIGQTVLPVIFQIGGVVQQTAVKVLSFLTPIVTYLMSNLWPVLSKVFSFIAQGVLPQIAGIVTALLPKITEIVSKVIQAVGAIYSNVKPILDLIFAAFNFIWPAIKVVVTNAIDAIGGVLSGLMKSLGGIIDFITGVFSGDWGKAWGGIKDTFAGIFEGLGAILVFPINVAIDAINAAIKNINKISFDWPDWVPKFGGEHFGLDIPGLNHVGGYAKGGYVDSPELAWVGEGRSPEWIIPENNSARSQGLLQAANRSMGGGNTNTIGDFIYNPVYQFNAPADQEAVRQMDQRHQQEFSKQFADFKRQAMRVSFE